MNYKEIKKEFESESPMMEVFYTHENSYTIGSRKITKLQFTKILNDYKGNLKFDLLVGGFTKHIYTYKKS